MIRTEAALSNLKDFQRRTVDYVFQRMYLDDDPAYRFLIADEVGLGKTLVARGLIARAIEKMQRDGQIDRIDVVYVCSNGAIARQNINRLNVTGEKNLAMASRLTLLPIHLKDLERNKINFVSFTPGTTFDLKSSEGTWQERSLIWRMLRKQKPFHTRRFQKMLRCSVSKDNWDDYCREYKWDYEESLGEAFLKTVSNDRELVRRIVKCSNKFHYLRREPDIHVRRMRNGIIADLRKVLANVCIGVLEPDLVIMDEFQRFRDLLKGETEASRLAKRLMEYVDPRSGTHARVLLLSATPYKMYTLSDEEEDHFSDFMETLRFLFDDPEKAGSVEKDLERYRIALFDREKFDSSYIRRIQDSLRSKLMSVMVRTERVGFTKNLDAMLAENKLRSSIEPQDLIHVSRMDRLSSEIGAGSVVEYWKSAPYLLNFMKKYVLKKKLDEALESGDRKAVGILRENMLSHLSQRDIMDFQSLEPGNPRLRSLVEETVQNNRWKLLWMPASMPYYRSVGVYSEVPDTTKTLVFSAWSVVPDAISAICSYEAERQQVRASEPVIQYRALHTSISQFLKITMKDDVPAGMSTMAMLYPSPFLAGLIDPLKAATESLGDISSAELLASTRERLDPFVNQLRKFEDETAFTDRSWQWAALSKLDSSSDRVRLWVERKRGGWKEVGTGSDREGDAFPEHVDHFNSAFSDSYRMGTMPSDLADSLAELALGSPAVCAARALKRVAPSLDYDDPVLMSAAAMVANGFRSLFNNPDSQLLIRGVIERDVPLWRAALLYSIDGNLQSVLDEYAHVLKESLGLFDHDDTEVATQVADAMFEALSIRVSNLTVDEFNENLENGSVDKSEFRMRCRYALRFSDIKDDTESNLIRAGTVRQAFNSPFKPFVLASTSIGQEGLDFHTYCHSVWHWNLPSNPVDLEQREGRVHRYKGHAVRKNIAGRFGLDLLRELWDGSGDPWKLLFKEAVRRRPELMNDIYPYWIFEDSDHPSKIRRTVPMLPCSKEESRLIRLKRSLALYRLAFGQPRQEDLLEFLARDSEDDMLEFRISLQPERETEVME